MSLFTLIKSLFKKRCPVACANSLGKDQLVVQIFGKWCTGWFCCLLFAHVALHVFLLFFFDLATLRHQETYLFVSEWVSKWDWLVGWSSVCRSIEPSTDWSIDWFADVPNHPLFEVLLGLGGGVAVFHLLIPSSVGTTLIGNNKCFPLRIAPFSPSLSFSVSLSLSLSLSVRGGIFSDCDLLFDVHFYTFRCMGLPLCSSVIFERKTIFLSSIFRVSNCWVTLPKEDRICSLLTQEEQESTNKYARVAF